MAALKTYQGAALATYEKIQKGINNIYINKIYKSQTAAALFFINSRGYLHILTPGKTNLNGRTVGYHLTDYILTDKNELKDNGDYTRDFNTVQELAAFIEKLTA